MRITSASKIPSRPAKRVSILLSIKDRSRHSSLMIRLMQHAREAKLPGATAFQAQQGFGVSGNIHRTRALGDDAPVTIVIVGTPERIDSFLAEVSDLVKDVLVVVEEIDVVELGTHQDRS